MLHSPAVNGRSGGPAANRCAAGIGDEDGAGDRDHAAGVGDAQMYLGEHAGFQGTVSEVRRRTIKVKANSMSRLGRVFRSARASSDRCQKVGVI